MDNQSILPQDKEGIWGQRTPVKIDIEAGIMFAGNAKRTINIDADISIALSSYLSMVYELRSLKSGVIPLRKDDIDALADVFELEESSVAEKLARLMHCDDLQTKRFIQMIKKGRVLVPVSMVAAGALLAVSLNFGIATTDARKTKTEVNLQQATLPANQKVQIGTGLQVERAEPTDAPEDTSNDVDTASTQTAEKSSTQSAQQDIQVDSNAVSQNDAPYPGPGEVIIGDGISVSRDDIQE